MLKLDCDPKLLTLVDKFFSKAEQGCNSIGELINAEDSPELLFQLHGLKGTSSLFGGHEITKTLTLMEHELTAPKPNWAALKTQLKLIFSQLEAYRINLAIPDNHDEPAASP